VLTFAPMPSVPARPAVCDLIVVDLDGTLLDSKGKVSPRNVAALRRAGDLGIEVVVATGRSWSESRHVLSSIDYCRPFIGAGGAVLSEGRTGRTIERRAMAAPLVIEVVASLARHGHPALLLKDAPSAQDSYVVVGAAPLDPASAWWFSEFGIDHVRVPHVNDDPHPEDTVRIGVVSGAGALAPMVEQVRGEIGDRAFLQHWSAVTSTEATGSETHLLEIFHPQVSKWSMVETLCRRNGIDPRRTVAIGDGLNDVEMLRGAGLGIAMGNAGAPARGAAQRITLDHDDDGVAHAIERVLDGDWTPRS
jgi:hydroxymethylpyrimidine pyrophosphatase-like HAD family hydrolase